MKEERRTAIPRSVTRILGIAPYEGLKMLMEAIAALHEEISLRALTGDYMEGLKLVSQTDLSDYDVIVSRGGTADLIRSVSSIPVIDLDYSDYDILNGIKLAQTYGGKFAIIGFPGTAHAASLLCDLFQYDIPIYTVGGEEEIRKVLSALRAEDVRMVLGDNMVTREAQKIGMQCALLASGSETVTKAFERAVQIASYNKKLLLGNSCYHAALSASGRDLIAVDSHGDICFSDTGTISYNQAVSLGRRLSVSLQNTDPQVFVRRIGKKDYLVKNGSMEYGREKFTLLELTQMQTFYRERFPGVKIRETAGVGEDFIRLYYNSAAGTDLWNRIRDFTGAGAVLLYGEEGTGKREAAFMLHELSGREDSIFFETDCGQLQKELLIRFLEDADSPLFLKGNVLFFRGIEKMRPADRGLLIDTLKEKSVRSGNQMIFSVEEQTGRPRETEEILRQIELAVSCIRFRLPALRERVHEIPLLAAMCLNSLNTHSTRQIAGIEPEGMTWLQSCRWEGNLRQFRQTLEILSETAGGAYIRTSKIKEILHTEEIEEIADLPAWNINIHQPLNKIVTQIITQLLEEGMTKTEAARQLGICRTTLWKYLT